MVEATSFEIEKITKDTCIENRFPPTKKAHAFDRIGREIDEKATDKRRQFDKITLPGVLAIVSSHLGSTLVLDAQAAQDALISGQLWRARADQPCTDLASSLFLRIDDQGKIVARNTSISAVLLFSVTLDRSYVSGTLNPAAEHKFKPDPLWMIPFIYLKDWPIQDRQLRCEWTLGNEPKPYPIEHKPIQPAPVCRLSLVE